jgi:hypothetical protein
MSVQPGNYVVGNISVSMGTSIPNDVGATQDGVKMTPANTTFSPNIDQELYKSRFWTTEKTFKIVFTMCEPTMNNIKTAWDVVNATTGTAPADTVLNFGTATLPEFVPRPFLGAFTSYAPGGSAGNLFTRTVAFTKLLLDTPGELSFTKSDIAKLPQTWNACYDASTSRVGTITDKNV